MKNECWILVRKPLSEKTIADNVLKWGVGGINIDGSRIATDEELGRINRTDCAKTNTEYKLGLKAGAINFGTDGRFPSNFIYTGCDEVFEEFDKGGYSKGTNRIGKPKGKTFGGGEKSWYS